MLATVVARTIAVVLLCVAALALPAGAIVGGTAGTVVWALCVPVVPAALAVLAAPRRAPRAVVTIGALALAVQAMLVALLVWPGAERVAGLPVATWWMLVGLGLLPLIVVPALYARSGPGPGGDGPGSSS